MHARLFAPVLAIAFLLGGAGACEDPPFPATGSLRIGTATTGGDMDADGYAVRVDAVQRGTIGTNDSLIIADLATGIHTVELTGVAPNCTVTGQNPRDGTVLRQTSRVDFAVTCVATGVRVSTTTTGPDIDANGYSVSVDGANPVTVGANASIDITGLAVGVHTLTLGGVAANCSVTGDNPRSVSVGNVQLLPVAFAVTCTAVTGLLEVRAATSGIDLDTNGYTIQVDSGSTHLLTVNGLLRVPGLGPGNHTVTLGGAAPNCAVSGDNPRTIPITTGGAKRDTARTTFTVTCAAFAGVIEVTTTTTGVDPDSGYRVRLDADVAGNLTANGVARFGVAGGAHEVALEDVAANCTVGGENPRTVTVTTGGATRDTARTTFTVDCVSREATARIITATTGTDLDENGYFVSVDCYDYYGGCYSYLYSAQMGPTDTVETVLPTGQHTFQIENIAPNCTLSGENSRLLNLAGGVRTDVVFEVVCAPLAHIEVTATTTGTDFDANGYEITVTGPTFTSFTIGVNETKQTPALLGGDYTVTLSGLSLNCALTSPGVVSVTAPNGATVPVSFGVNCTLAADQVAFSTGDIYRVQSNGGARTQLTSHDAYDAGPAWSPDGSTIAFWSVRDGNAEIYVMNAVTGANQTRLTTNSADDTWPAFSPDGTRIAFTSRRDGNNEIYVMDAAGTNPVNLTVNSFDDAEPAWSPDGTKIAFASARGGIHVMNANGTGVTQVTHDATDGRPAWSPDGTKLVFSRVTECGGYYSYYCQRDLYIVNSDGSGLAPLVTGSDDTGEPAWSPDGEWIAFSSGPCDYYYGCYEYSVKAVRSNGTDVRFLATAQSFHPAWKP